MRGRKRSKKLPELNDVYFPPDITMQILARLPPKTLMQFRCVCRDWCSLIDEPYFITLHWNLYQNCHAKTQLVTVELLRGSSSHLNCGIRRIDTFRKIAYFFKYSKCYVFRESSLVHGLLLFSNSDYLTLFNPCIRKSLTLPCCPLRLKGVYDTSCFLGYVESHNDHKVVVFNCIDRKTFVLEIAIYSLRDCCWRTKRIKVPECCWCNDNANGSVNFQGAVYLRPGQKMGTNVDIKLQSFHFDSEEFHYMKLPDIEEGMGIFLFLFGESLAFFGISSVRSCIWVLETNAGNHQWWQYWNRENNISDDGEFFQKILVSAEDIQILYVEDTGTFLFRLRMDLMAYNITSNQRIFLAKRIPLIHVDTYVESLVLHKGYGVVSTSGT